MVWLMGECWEKHSGRIRRSHLWQLALGVGGYVTVQECRGMRIHGSCVPFEYFTMCIYYLFKKNFSGDISHLDSDFQYSLKKLEALMTLDSSL